MGKYIPAPRPSSFYPSLLASQSFPPFPSQISHISMSINPRFGHIPEFEASLQLLPLPLIPVPFPCGKCRYDP